MISRLHTPDRQFGRVFGQFEADDAAAPVEARFATEGRVDLEAKRALGLEEAAADKKRALDKVETRCNELERRSKALSRLLRLLSEKRATTAGRLRAPLQRHLNHHLQILLPGAGIEVSEDLSPGCIIRVALWRVDKRARRTQRRGGREQGGHRSTGLRGPAARRRQAHAAHPGRAGSHRQRSGQMKRVLYDAANRHQTLVFSCHPQAWQDPSVATRELSQTAGSGIGGGPLRHEADRH